MAHEWTKLQREWIAALRSGNYAQTTERLKDEKGYCCLGVAVHLMEDHISPEDTNLSLTQYRQLGLRGRDGEFFNEGGEDLFDGNFSLAEANDDGKTFVEIADFIEAHPEDVFWQDEDEEELE